MTKQKNAAPEPAESTDSGEAAAERRSTEPTVTSSPAGSTVLTPGYEDAVARGVEGGAVAIGSECTFPGCGEGRVEHSYMCAEHTDAHARAVREAEGS